MTIALLLNSRIPFRNVLTGLMLLPWIVPEVVTAMAWRSIFDPIFGGLNPILIDLGLIDRRVAWLAEPQPGDAQRDRGQHLEGYSVLYHVAAGWPQGDRQGTVRSRRSRRCQCGQPLPAYHVARPEVCDRRDAAAVDDLDVQYLWPGLPDDRRWSRRRHPAVFDPGLRTGDHRSCASVPARQSR